LDIRVCVFHKKERDKAFREVGNFSKRSNSLKEVFNGNKNKTV
jgi:hypothetical protein